MIYERSNIRVQNNSSSNISGVSIVAMVDTNISQDFGSISANGASEYKQVVVASLEQLLISPGMWNTIGDAYLNYNNGSPSSLKLFQGNGKTTSPDQGYLLPNSSYTVILTDTGVSIKKD
jgi:hypothetical protein